MNCPNCRKEATAEAAECPGCGLIISKWKGRARPAPAAARAEDPKRPRTTAVLGIVFILGLVALLFVFALGKKAPDFELPDTAGNMVRLSDYGDKLVLLDFSNPECPDCERSLPFLKALHETFAREFGLTVLAVVTYHPSPDQPQSGKLKAYAALAAADYVRRFDIPYKVLLDYDGAVYARYGCRAVPDLVLIGRGGRIWTPHMSPWPNNEVQIAIIDANAGISRTAGLILFALYNLMMAYGAFTLGSAYFLGATRHIPQFQFLALAILLPLATMVSIFLSHLAIGPGLASASGGFFMFSLAVYGALPVSLAYLYIRHQAGARAEAWNLERLRVGWKEKVAEADRALADDPHDALTHWHKAKAQESLEEYEAALKTHEMAHALSDKVTTRAQLEDHYRRIGALIQRRDDLAALHAERFGIFRYASVEAMFFACGVVLFFALSELLALQLCSYMLFIAWFRSAERN
ncbi:MAG: peroxiredoxin family protein [Elusimicrobiota bacterium]